ncbi:hypothetical protein [Nocardia blacklockiae]|uniref:hypothetical protein n=1 Tax=Nocardia blacklockiae TaxID=480036 RepID=UPI001893BF78|nr:hypothetical protein [Nocardia blacklockiae]MBF6171344.1 hypothetical protein [Nocardia blacklockiae]
MADKPSLGSGVEASWVTITGTDEKKSATWAGYGQAGVSVDAAVDASKGDYRASDDAAGILDFSGGISGLDTLHWFHLVQARYALTGKQPPADIPALATEKGIDTLYFRQRDMRLNNLFGAGQRIDQALPRIRQADDDQQQATRLLAGYWQGPTGATVQDKLTKLGTWSADALAELNALPGIIGTVVDEIKRCLQRKAEAFAAIGSVQRINGVNMMNGESIGKAINSRNADNAAAANDDVSLILLYAARRGIGDSVRERIEQIAAEGVAFGPNPGLPPRKNKPRASTDGGTGASVSPVDNTEFDDKAQQLCQLWRQHFWESVEGYFRAYSTLCADTDRAVQGYLQVVIDALNHVGHLDKPPVPAGDPSQPGPSQPGPSQPGPSQPGPSQPGPSQPGPSTTQTAGVQAAAQTNPLQTLTSLAGQAAQTVQQGVGQLESAVQQGLSGLAGGVPGGSLSPSDTGAGSKTLANFNVAGSNLAVTQSPNGTVTATLTGPDGKPRQYSVGIKDGVPFFTPGGDPSAEPAAAEGVTHGSTPGGSAQGTSGHSGSAPGPSGHVGASGSGVPASGQHSSVPTTGTPEHGVSSTGQTGSGTSESQPMAANSAGMPGMPMGGGAGGSAKGGSGNERSSTGIVPPQPLWTDLPGRDGPTLEAPEGASEPALGPELSLAGPLPPAPVPNPPAEIRVETAAPPAEPAPPRRTDGVKIEIDLGDR